MGYEMSKSERQRWVALEEARPYRRLSESEWSELLWLRKAMSGGTSLVSRGWSKATTERAKRSAKAWGFA